MERKILSGAMQTLLTLIIIFLVVVSLYPILWMVLNSFKSNNEVFQRALALPSQWNFQVFSDAWTTYKLGPALRNSIVITASVVILNLIISALAAFATSHLKFLGNRIFLAFCIGCQVVSAQVLLVPLYKMLNDFQLYNTFPGLILAMVAFSLPMSVYLFHNFFRSVPKDIYESTKIDGCGSAVYFIRILLPLSAPIIASVAIFQALFAWNEFIFALTFLRDAAKWTIQLQIKNMFQGYSVAYGRNFAALSIVIIPILLIYIAMQKYFIRGLTAGAVKG